MRETRLRDMETENRILREELNRTRSQFHVRAVVRGWACGCACVVYIIIGTYRDDVCTCREGVYVHIWRES